MSFKYDPFGRRIEKISPTTTSIFAYDGNNLIETVNATGGVVARYTQGQNIDEPLAESRSGTVSYYEQDGIGSVTSLTNSSGTVAQTYTYDSFGNQTASSGSLTNFFRYAGREFDTETGLYYYRARYYDPSTGRFLSEDRLTLHRISTAFISMHETTLRSGSTQRVWTRRLQDRHLFLYRVADLGMDGSGIQIPEIHAEEHGDRKRRYQGRASQVAVGIRMDTGISITERAVANAMIQMATR